MKSQPNDEHEQSEVLELLADFPVDEYNTTREEWVWTFVQKFKRAMSSKKGYGCQLWNPYNVIKVFITELISHNLPREERKRLVREYNNALGASRFPSDWPETVHFTVDSLMNDGLLPPLDPQVFTPSPTPSPYYPQLLSAVYMVGTYDNRFIFAPHVYGKLFGCSAKTVCKFMSRIVTLGMINIIKRGEFIPKGKGKHTWYSLNDENRILNTFQFPSEEYKRRFTLAIHSFRKPTDGINWGDYVITPEFLYKHYLM